MNQFDQDTIPSRLDELNSRLDNVEGEVVKLRSEMKSNTEATERIESNTEGIVQMMNDAKGAWRVLEVLSNVAKSVTVVLAFCGILFLAVKGWVIGHDIGGMK